MDELKRIEQLREMVKSVVNAELAPLREQQATSFAKLIAGRSSLSAQDREKGLTASRVIRAIVFGAGSKTGLAGALKHAKERWDDPVVEKALSSSDPSAGGFLLSEETSTDLIEVLRPMGAVTSLSPRFVSLDSGLLQIPKVTTGSSGGWIGENTNAPATQPVFGQAVLVAKKYSSLVPISNDLIRRSSTAAEEFIRDDLTADIASATDLEYIRGDGTAGTPEGLRNLAASGNVVAANGTVNLANVTIDLGKALQGLMDNNVKMIRPGWIFNARQWRYLYTVQTTTGAYAFKPEMDQNTLFGFPFRITSQIPNTLGGGTESEVYFADFADIVIGQGTNILIDASTEAAYHDGSNVVAAFSLDQMVIRAIIETDIITRHAESIFVLTTVKWGA